MIKIESEDERSSGEMSKKGHSPENKKVKEPEHIRERSKPENFTTEPEKEKADEKASEEKVSEEKASEGKAKGEKTSEEKVSDEKEMTSDGKAPEEKASEEKPIDEKKEEADEQKKEPSPEKKLSPEQQKIEDLEDRVKRQMAEFENFRKRTEKEKADSFDQGSRKVFEKILPVIDNFERGLEQAKEGDAFADGIKMIYKQFVKILTDMGLEEIDAKGKEFDPNLHNAVMTSEANEEFGENIVSEELQKGYQYHGVVVRPSMVKVAK